MTRTLTRTTLALCAVMLTACASMNPDECRQADWQARGLLDGRSGRAATEINDHREACAKVGVMPNETLWRTGWLEGLKAYCTPNAAWNAGLRNDSYRGVCTDLDEASFLRFHRAGQLVYRARQELSQNQSTITRLEGELRKASRDEDRRRLRDELSRAERERSRLHTTVLVLEAASPPR